MRINLNYTNWDISIIKMTLVIGVKYEQENKQIYDPELNIIIIPMLYGFCEYTVAGLCFSIYPLTGATILTT